MARQFDRKLILEDGEEYFGYGFGDFGSSVCEIVFNNMMIGYQEVVYDPSYTQQAVVMTYPLIGNYGITEDVFSSKVPTLGALIVREYNDLPSNFRSTKTLSEIMEENRIPGIYGLDTRKLARSIRDKGCRRVLITDFSTTLEEGLEIIKNTPEPTDLVDKVSCKRRWYSRTSNQAFNVIALDCGIRNGVIRALNEKECNVTVVPWNTSAEEIISMKPDGLLISNGPGSPMNLPSVIELVKTLKGKYPIFGMCLGHQIICMAYGAKVSKLKFGHHGGNYPVKDLETNKIEISTQNHNYVVDSDSLEKTGLKITHINLMDNTVEGVANESDKVIGIQYNPESAPESYLFDRFIANMKEGC